MYVVKREDYLGFKRFIPDLNLRLILAVLCPDGEDVAQELPVDGGDRWRVPVHIQPRAQAGDLAPYEGWSPAGP